MERITRLANDCLPKPHILHPWPQARFAVKHPRWEPYAGIRSYGSVRGALSNERSYREFYLLIQGLRKITFFGKMA